jgi:nucleoid DNA-binding protein
MTTLTKFEVSKRISEKTGFSASLVEDVVGSILCEIIEITKNDYKLHIKNFGNFEIVKKSSRPGRDIGKNTAVIIPEKQVLKFSAARTLRELLNNKK